MKVLAVGASRGVGYYGSVPLLFEGHTVVFLLRNPLVLEEDPSVAPYLKSGNATLIRCDATNEEQVADGWNQAVSDGTPFDVVICSVGYRGPLHLSLTKGLVTSPNNLCAVSFLNVLVMVARQKVKPKVVAVTSQGITKEEHARLPFLLRPAYSMLEVPLADKHGMEQLAAYSAGWEWKDHDCTGDILPRGLEEKLGGVPKGWLRSIILVRPALLTDGAERGKYRVMEDPSAAYTISRRDAGHFISKMVATDFSRFEGKAVTLAY